jgi:hypothetical protein
LRKNSRGEGLFPVRRNFVPAACSELRIAFQADYRFPVAPSFAPFATGGIRSRRRLGKHETNSIPERRYQIQSCKLPHVFLLATPAECALTQKRGEGPLRGAEKSTNRMSFCAIRETGTPQRRKAITGGEDGCIRAATRCAQ